MITAPSDLRVAWVTPSTPSGDGAHDFFNRVTALPTCIGALSLRNQVEINAATKTPPNRMYSYIWPKDPHPEAQDAAKYILPELKADGTKLESQPGDQKVVLPLGVTSGIVVVSWEFYYTRDWQRAFTPLPGEDWKDYKFKTFQITHPDEAIYFESRNLWGRRRGDAYVSVADVRLNPGFKTAAETDAFAAKVGLLDVVGYMPTGERALPNYGADTGKAGGFDVPVSQWLRYTAEIQIGVDAAAFNQSWNLWRPKAAGFPAWTGPIPPGRYNMLSATIAGETFDPIWVIDRVPAPYKTGLAIGAWYSEMNTSAHIQRHGDAIGYIRNVVAWKADRGLADDPSLLSRPVR